MRRLFVCFLVFACLTSCISADVELAPASPQEMPTPYLPPLPAPSPTPMPAALWISPAVPDSLRPVAAAWGVPLADQPEHAGLHLELASGPTLDGVSASWVYALVAPFPTITDGVTLDELHQAWAGTPPAFVAGKPLLMDESTRAVFTALWGEPASGSVWTVASDQLLDAAWGEYPSWAVVPFESIQPKWKVLTIDGRSPLRKDFDLSGYPLLAGFSLTCAAPCPLSPIPQLPATNRDPSRLTTVVMTGVTALVRSTAYTMENKGALYPGQHVRGWLREADVAHISNEVSFFSKCPFPNRNQRSLIFCSSQAYMDLLLDVGTDVVELTGDHLIDYGYAALQESLDFYKEKGLPYYGGGVNAAEAQQPLLLEVNGNKLAFIGCNAKGAQYPKATDTIPGPAVCDWDYMTAQIGQLKEQGYNVLASFSWHESYGVTPHPLQVRDFRLMADSGAVVVSGSQAHRPQLMEFYNGAFIHYGLGNLFFDQMYYNRPDGVVLDKEVRSEFLDRHVFYDGRYLGTELLTAMLEDYSSPRPMEPSERFEFLQEIFGASGWDFVSVVPTLTPTVAPTPLVLGTPGPTPTP